MYTPATFNTFIDPVETPVLMARLDGDGFSSFTAEHFTKPHDPAFQELMFRTTEHLMRRWNATAAFTNSDEITLCWTPDVLGGEELLFGGRCQKLASELAGAASVYFALSIRDADIRATPHFDARVWGVPDAAAARAEFDRRQRVCRTNALGDQIHWRTKRDCEHAATRNFDNAQRVAWLRDNGFWSDIAQAALWGIFLSWTDVQFTMRQYVAAGFMSETKYQTLIEKGHTTPDKKVNRRAVEHTVGPANTVLAGTLSGSTFVLR